MRYAQKAFLVISAVLAALMPTNISIAISANDFYFTDFTADYYLTKADDGMSHLHVQETLTAIFPDANQNHGITRTIPFLNQAGTNRTISSISALNFSATRNGATENVSQIVDDGDHYTVYIGDANAYVHGEQVYVLEYDFTNVITEFDVSGANVSGQNAPTAFQELYWDTNGTGWTQHFDKVTANLHFASEIQPHVYQDTWCYVGRYGESGSERCSITRTSDGFNYTAANLQSGENLTFVAEFDSGTFEAVQQRSYIWLVLLLIVTVVIIFLAIKKYFKWRKNGRSQYLLYRSLFTAPQYQPPENPNLHVAEGEQNYLGKARPSYVATLLELAVSKKITIAKSENGKKIDWTVCIAVDPIKLSEPQRLMLNILANQKELTQGMEIPIQKHTPSQSLADYAKDYYKTARNTLIGEGYMTEDNKKSILKNSSTKNSGGVFGIITAIIGKIVVCGVIFLVAWYIIEDYFTSFWRLFFQTGVEMVGQQISIIAIIVILLGYITFATIMNQNIAKYSKYTDKGIKLAKYLEGLEMYIAMAEKDRLAFLQSAKGADTSSQGIVKLYEKLLPWASLFGAEKSWVKELAKYYEIANVSDELSPDLLDDIITANMLSNVNRIVQTSTTYIPPSSSYSGGGGSSFSSGGGGGGFSGGGGGGGGGGGW